MADRRVVRRTVRRLRDRSTPPREVRRLHQYAHGPWRQDEPVVALTFDDGPFLGRTPSLLDALDDLGVPATFFLVGLRVDRAPELARRYVEGGHQVASHTYTHKNLTRVDAKTLRREIIAGHRSVAHHTGQAPRCFRPPFSARDDAVRGAVHDDGQVLVHWSVSVNDRERDTDGIVAGVTDGLEPGAIVVLHELEQTIAALPAIVETAHARGLRFVTLDGNDGRRRRPAPRPHRTRSATPAHTAGLLLGEVEADHTVHVVDVDDPHAVGYGVWAAARTGTALLPTSGGRLSAPYRAQLERLAPELLVLIGEHAAVPDELVPAETERRHHRDPSEVVHASGPHPDVLLAGTADPARTLLVASTAARAGAGLALLPPDATPAALAELLARLGTSRLLGCTPADPSLRSASPAGVATTWLDQHDPDALGTELAARFPGEGSSWRLPAPDEHDAIVAAALAASGGATIRFDGVRGVERPGEWRRPWSIRAAT